MVFRATTVSLSGLEVGLRVVGVWGVIVGVGDKFVEDLSEQDDRSKIENKAIKIFMVYFSKTKTRGTPLSISSFFRDGGKS